MYFILCKIFLKGLTSLGSLQGRILFFFLKSVYYKRKDFSPYGSKFFLFTLDPFQKGGMLILTALSFLNWYLFTFICMVKHMLQTNKED